MTTVQTPTPQTLPHRHPDATSPPTAGMWPTTSAVVTVSKQGRGLAAYLWALTRLSLATVFLWAFFDKVFGLGHETTVAHAWINGGSPSLGFLSGATGPFAGFYQGIAGAGSVDWTFMIGLIGIGVALLLGIGMRIAAVSGAVMMVLMWSASLPPQDHIFMDNHIIYALVLLGIALAGAGNILGFRCWWTGPAWFVASPGSPELGAALAGSAAPDFRIRGLSRAARGWAPRDAPDGRGPDSSEGPCQRHCNLLQLHHQKLKDVGLNPELAGLVFEMALAQSNILVRRRPWVRFPPWAPFPLFHMGFRQPMIGWTAKLLEQRICGFDLSKALLQIAAPE
jgi:thiosulfate dehydrogenase (quinone) large subunit